MPDLTTKAAVKAWAGITGTADDDLLDRVVSAVSESIERQLGRVFSLLGYTETRNGNGRPEMFTRQYPITAVASVTIDGASVPARTGVTGSGFTFDTDTIYIPGHCFRRGVQNVVLQYTAGYLVTPPDLAQATTEAIAFLYRERDRIGLSSKAMSGETTAFMRDLPPHLMKRLMQHAAVAVPE